MKPEVHVITDGAVFGTVSRPRPSAPWTVSALETRRTFPSWEIVDRWLQDNSFQIFDGREGSPE